MIQRSPSRYEILKKLGAGGMAEVYLAHDSKLNRKVALKFLLKELAEDPAFRRRFLREARAAAAVDHPYVCKIYEVEELEEKTCLVLEYVEGETLHSRLQHGRLPVDEALKIAAQTAEAVTEAHRNGIIHRDIKPGNIMLTPRHHVKVMDFGLAKQLGTSQDQTGSNEATTRRNSLMGTLQYMSPEQLRGEPADHRSDIFAFGIVLYEMLTGVHPFRKPTVQAVMAAILHENHKPVRELVPGVSEGIESIISRLLAKPSESRAASMQDVLSEIEQVQRGFDSQWLEKPAEFTLAVLPFSDMSEGKKEEYFCDGLVEELIGALTQLDGMRVVSRTSAFRFKGRDEDVRKIAAELNVKAVIEGSIRKLDKRVRITVKLVSGETGYPLWSEQFDSELAGIFEIQDAIAKAVAEKLKTTVSVRKKTSPITRPAIDIEAYDQYLRGIYSWNKRTEDGLKSSIEHFKNAIFLAPQYVLAQTGLADALITLVLYGALPPDRAIGEARDAIDRALVSEPECAAALTARACLRSIHEWDWPAAEQDFEAAIRHDPNSALAYHWYANNLLIPLGRFDEARDKIRAAQRLEPFSPPIAISSGIVSFFERRYLRAADELRQALHVEPGFGMAHYFFGQVHTQTRNYREALVALSFAKTLTGSSPEVISVLGCTHAAAGNAREAEKCLAELRQLAEDRYISPVLPAQICVGLGQFEEAVSYIQLACNFRAADLIWLGVRPSFDPIRSHPRFVEICSKLGLPPSTSTQSSGAR